MAFGSMCGSNRSVPSSQVLYEEEHGLLGSEKYNKPEFFKAQISQTNAFRGPNSERPPEEVDEAWTNVGIGMPGLRLSGEEIEQSLGKQLVDGTESQHPVPDGKGGYIAMLEVFHMLHCLDELRKALFYNWDYYSADYLAHNATSSIIQNHHDHCVDALRMSLMCSADVTPVTFIDDSAVPQRRNSLPDFSTKHTCRNFEEIVNWSWENERAIMWEDVGDATTWDPTSVEQEAGHSHESNKHDGQTQRERDVL
ncbi:hypothetical protein SLS60_011507 [Paraconiothyrium brasiliense]|uniref:Cyclochlorotine biosynthesis protein O n=1 Tax=Paraconiothyrium brasiliense TaxID=300254 RepID=A0ABR3QIC8_9PLEO